MGDLESIEERNPLDLGMNGIFDYYRAAESRQEICLLVKRPRLRFVPGGLDSHQLGCLR
jgi:hypothetical protein